MNAQTSTLTTTELEKIRALVKKSMDVKMSGKRCVNKKKCGGGYTR